MKTQRTWESTDVMTFIQGMLQLKLIRKTSAGWVIRIITLIMSMHNNKPFKTEKKIFLQKKHKENLHSIMHCKNQKICFFNSLSSICIYYIKLINWIRSCLSPIPTSHINGFTNESWYWYDIKIQKTNCVFMLTSINIKTSSYWCVCVYLVPQNHFFIFYFFGQVNNKIK